MNRFIIDEWRGDAAQKRGGGAVPVSLDDQAQEPPVSAPDNPETIFDLQCALQMIDEALARLRAEHERSGKLRDFELLKSFMMVEKLSAADCSAIARQLDKSEGSLKVEATRMRQRFRKLFYEVVSETVADPADVEDEVRYLCEILARWT